MGLLSWLLKGEVPDSDLVTRMDRLERKLTALDEEWTETYDNFRRLSAKVAKRAKQLEDAEDRAAQEELPLPRGNGARPLTPAEKTRVLQTYSRNGG